MRADRRSTRRGPARAFERVTARQAITAALTLRGLSQEVRAERIATEWADLVGGKIASRTCPRGVQGRVLVVEVASSTWLHELTLLRPRLLGELLARVGEPRLFDDLSFRIAGRSRASPAGVRRASPIPQQIRPQQPATGAARDQIVHETEAVDDAELRALITRIRVGNDR